MSTPEPTAGFGRAGWLLSRVQSRGEQGASRLRARAATVALLLGLIAVCSWLGFEPYFVGPADFDDAMYSDFAVSGTATWEVRNRYAHVWALRLAAAAVDPRRTAASAYSVLAVVGLSWLGFLLGRRIAGVLGGVAALLCMVLFPPMLRYISMPHVDLTMTFWVLLAILAASLALSADGRRRIAWAALSGFAAYLALKSKETALPLLGVLLYLGATESRRRAQDAGAWLSGAALGCLLLLGLDAAFMSDASFMPSNPFNYFTIENAAPAAPLGLPQPSGPAKYLRHRHLFGEMMQPPFWAFLFLGVAGMAEGFRKNALVRALALWFLGSVAFTLLIAWRSSRIQIYDRYLIGPGAALVVMAAYWLVALWNRPRSEDRTNALWLSLLIAGLLAIAVPALIRSYGEPSEADRNAVVFLLPFTLFLLGVTPFIASGRWLSFGSAVVMLAISGYASVMTASDHVDERRRELAPWILLARRADEQRMAFAVWQAPEKYPARRVLWRVRSLSRRALPDVRVRDLPDPAQLAPNEWLFTRGCYRRDLMDKGFVPLLGARCEERTWAWSVYQRAPSG